jgi:[acyl-carrier-protein] S-malonyltransferase
MGKVAFVFPGQGAQAVGMGRALYDAVPEARAAIDAAHEALAGEVDLRALLFDGPEDDLKRTANTQPAILTVSAAAHAALKARAPDLVPAFVAGHSLGEYSALVAAGSLALADAVRVVRSRGAFMQEAVPEGVGAMAAVVGLDAGAVQSACDVAIAAGAEVVSPANLNSPEQTVIAGERAAVEAVSVRLKEAGAKRVLPLPVSAPFHCALMAPVQPRLKAVLDEIEVRPPAMPLVSNVEAAPVDDPAKIRDLLIAQVVAPVRWVESVQALAAAGVTDLVELGPGKVLSGLVRRIDKSLTCHNVEDPAGLEKVLEALGGAG